MPASIVLVLAFLGRRLLSLFHGRWDCRPFHRTGRALGLLIFPRSRARGIRRLFMLPLRHDSLSHVIIRRTELFPLEMVPKHRLDDRKIGIPDLECDVAVIDAGSMGL